MKRSLTLFGTAMLLLSATTAFADTLVMQCNKSDCARARCDDWRENCSPVGYFQRAKGQFAVPQSKQICDEFGDCHFALPSLLPVTSTKSTPAVKPKQALPPPKIQK